MVVSHVGIVGPISTEEVRDLLDDPFQPLPMGYLGAPLMSILIRELLKQGLRVTAFTTSMDMDNAKNQLFRAAGPGFELCVVPSRPRAWQPNGIYPGRILDLFRRERRALCAALKSIGPDVVHAHWTYEFALAALATGLPSLVTCHDAPQAVVRYTKSPYRAMRYLMARRAFRRGKHFTAVSPYMRSIIQGYTSQTVKVVPNPVAPYVRVHSRARDLPVTRRVAMICNGWNRFKNPQVGLKAFSLFLHNNKDAELHLFGADCGLGQIAESWAQSKQLNERVHFHGTVTHRSLIAQLSDMDVLLHPALEESFGVVIAEAMALGLPVVAGQKSGAVSWVAGMEEGSEAASLLCDVRDAAAVAHQLRRAFSSRYRFLSEAGIARSESYSSADIVQQYIKAYAHVVSESGRCIPSASAAED